MGRRKIEIKAIQDDRNRSVTFLKRKGGLFKKAHELSVLCNVDVAVIIFGQNKKLYQYSSGDIHSSIGRHYQYINQFGAPHEHKGPNDFPAKGGDDDDDDDDVEPEPESEQAPLNMPAHHHQQPPTQHHQPPPLQVQPGLQRVTHHTPQNSPPLNGSFGSRVASPQPMGMSRPASRTHNRRVSSNLVPQNHPQPHAAQPGSQGMQYGYQQNPAYYQSPQPPHQNMQMQPPQPSPPVHQHTFPHATPPHAQMSNLYLQEHGRRQSMPPNFPSQAQDDRQAMQMTPQQVQQHIYRSPQPPQRPMNQNGNSQGLFAPIDEERANMAQRFEDRVKVDPALRPDLGPRSQSVDEANALRININGQSPRNQFAPPPSNQSHVFPRAVASASLAPPPGFGNFQPPQGKRPSLKVQIPLSEQTESEGGTAESSGKENTTNEATTPVRSKNEGSSGLVLPAPSPRSASAGALLSPSATGPSGPSNPFARPAPPSHAFSQSNSGDGNVTPASALPSRMMGDLINSPSSSFWNNEWGSYGNTFGGTSLVSPATYQPTPIATSNPHREELNTKRRNSSDEGGQTKKTKA